MSPLPSREELEAMKRVDLQKLCKGYGVKANLKTEALIELLLNETQRPIPQQTQRAVPRRVSSRIGSRQRGRSGGSMIVHDTDEDEETNGTEPEPEPEPQSQLVSAPGPISRTRKAKETQTRLGVGRPVIAGGSGARAVTKPPSVSKQKRGRSKGTKPTEATIPEEESEPERSSQKPNRLSETDPKHDQPDSEQLHRFTPSNANALLSTDIVEKHVAEALKPIHEQLRSLKTNLEHLKSVPTEVTQLSNTVADYSDLRLDVKGLTIAVETLQTQFNTLTAEVKHLRDVVMASSAQPRVTGASSPLGSAFQSPSKKTSGTALSFSVPSSLKSQSLHQSLQTSEPTAPVASTSKSVLSHPGFAPSTLGKRHRDSTTSNVTGVFDEGQEDGYTEAELATKVSRPNKKKARISHGVDCMNEGADESASKDVSCQPGQEAGKESSDKPRVPSFTVFSGPEEPPEEYEDPPPPTNLLPESFAPGSPPSRPTTSTASAAENQNPFNFSFLPHSTTGQSMFPLNLPTNFPFPEPPQSPSPSGPSQDQRGADRQEPTNIFQTRFGVAGRPGSGAREPGGGFIDPAALVRPPDRVPSSNDIASGLGLTAVRATGDGRDQNYPPSKRTMYGTELEGDTRFGDFGVEGVGSGFWTGGRF